MSDETYCYPPDFTVLRNRFGIRDAALLDEVEREFVALRMLELVPSGHFDLAHLRAIHRHLFQDVYDWAGDIRTVEIAKGGSQFQFRRYIETGMGHVHRRLVASNYLRDLSRAEFAKGAGEIIGDVNYVHPFREGNGRVQLVYLRQLAEQAGHTLDLSRLAPDDWMKASRRAQQHDFAPMGRCIARALVEFRRERDDQPRRRMRRRY